MTQNPYEYCVEMTCLTIAIPAVIDRVVILDNAAPNS